MILLWILLLFVFIVTFLFSYKLSSTPTNCLLMDWNEFGDCSRDCNGGYRYAFRSYKGNCSPELLIRSQSCNETINCGQSCIPNDPNIFPWLDCQECGINIIQWKIIPPIQTATYGGTDCKLEDVLQTRLCNVPPCPPNIDCEYSPYTTTSCNVVCGSGTQIVYQSITTFPSGNGLPCDPTQLAIEQFCYVDCTCPPFTGPYTTCNSACGPGIQVRLNSYTSPNCPLAETQTCSFTYCDNLTCAPPSVQFIEALCLLSCSGYQLPQIAPGVCSTTRMMDAICTNLGACLPPEDCSLTTWSNYSTCSEPSCNSAFQDGGTQTAVRTIVKNAVGGGIQCDQEVTFVSKPCNNWEPISYEAYDTNTNIFFPSISGIECTSTPGCEYSDWYFVSTCSAPCNGTGEITLFRSITRFPDNPFTRCTESLVTHSICFNNTPCIPCIWQSPDSDPAFQLQCPYVIPETISQSVNLLSGNNCGHRICSLNTNSLSIFPPGKVGNVWQTLSCSAYAKACTGYSTCPSPGNRTCNGTGLPVMNLGTCTCNCFDGWEGIDCATVSVTCPVGPTGIICNGFPCLDGVCQCPNGGTGSCDFSWCWINADMIYQSGGLVNPDFPLPIRKLYGAIPIIDSEYGSFSFNDCIQLKSSFTGTLSLSTPAPVLSDGGGFLESNHVDGIFVGTVRPDYPSTLFYGNCDTYSDDVFFESITGIPSYLVIHRYLKGSSPVDCEQLFQQRFMNNISRPTPPETTNSLPIPRSFTTGTTTLAGGWFQSFTGGGYDLFVMNDPNTDPLPIFVDLPGSLSYFTPSPLTYHELALVYTSHRVSLTTCTMNISTWNLPEFFCPTGVLTPFTTGLITMTYNKYT